MQRSGNGWQKRLAAVEALLTPPVPAVDAWHQRVQKRMLDAATVLLGADIAAQLKGPLLDVEVLITKLSMGIPPTSLEWELNYAVQSRHVPASTIATLRSWLDSPAGQARSIDLWYAFRHDGHVERDAQAALGRAWLHASHAPADRWESLDAGDQAYCWSRTVLFLAYAFSPHAFGLPLPNRAAEIAIAERGVELVKEYLHWSVEHSLGARGAIFHHTGHWPALPLGPEVGWAKTLRQVLDGDDQADWSNGA